MAEDVDALSAYWVGVAFGVGIMFLWLLCAWIWFTDRWR